jgi:hypothetical protein
MEKRAHRYSHWVRNETVEDYSLRYAPRSFRRCTPFVVASSALGGVAYLADFAIGGSLAVNYGTLNALAGIGVAAVIIFLTGAILPTRCSCCRSSCSA